MMYNKKTRVGRIGDFSIFLESLLSRLIVDWEDLRVQRKACRLTKRNLQYVFYSKVSILFMADMPYLRENGRLQLKVMPPKVRSDRPLVRRQETVLK